MIVIILLLKITHSHPTYLDTENVFSIFLVSIHVHSVMICKMRGRGCGLVDVAQDRDKWRTVINTVMNSSFSKKCREFLDLLRNC